jgi:hypothetical protein
MVVRTPKVWELARLNALYSSQGQREIIIIIMSHRSHRGHMRVEWGYSGVVVGVVWGYNRVVGVALAEAFQAAFL